MQALTQALRRGVEQAGTVTVESHSGTESRERTEVRRLDLREAGTPRMQVEVAGQAAPVGILVGDRAWRRSPYDPQDPYSIWQRPDSDLVWLTLLDTPIDPEGAWRVGTGEVDGVSAEHLVVLTGTDLAPTAPPGGEPWAGRVHVDMWVAQDSHRVVRAAIVHGTEPGARRIDLRVTYGEDMTITPPDPAWVEASPSR